MENVLAFPVEKTHKSTPLVNRSDLTDSDKAVLGEMKVLLQSISDGGRLTVEDIKVYDDVATGDTQAVAFFRLFDFAPMTVFSPATHSDLTKKRISITAKQVVEKMLEYTEAERAAKRREPFKAPLRPFEKEAKRLEDRMFELAQENHLKHAEALKSHMSDRVVAEMATHLAEALWYTVMAFAQNALWAKGRLQKP